MGKGTVLLPKDCLLNLCGLRPLSLFLAEMSSGKVALYVLALRSACQNPTDVSTPEKHVNLVQVLEKKTKEEIKHFDTTRTPKTDYYQLALDTLALCVEKSSELKTAASALADAALDNRFQFQGRFSVDIGAVASLALFCVDKGISSQQSELTGTIKKALALITKQILDEQQKNGTLGNIYSTGLAMQVHLKGRESRNLVFIFWSLAEHLSLADFQALNVTSEFYGPTAWNCEKTLEVVLDQVTKGAFSPPADASQILPSLVGKTYLDVRSLTCTSENVTVHYNVINVIKEPHFNFSITVKVPKGSVLLAVLEAAQQANPSEFRFQTGLTHCSPMVTSINALQASTNEKTYWQFLSGKAPLEQGIYIILGRRITATFFSYINYD
ncbi:transcobalamin-1-like isoform X1 [Python bivittatus]|uniref:Transcobalamin-1-like isoform X1 n=1 Tax=Python bivittatus TaxID=176946 RepID=A0A9F5IXC0_PYTBI|nr:transcobalamin-1-like isoform X1 [Python bivittatus]